MQQDADAFCIMKMPNGKRVNAIRIKATTTINNNGHISASMIYRILAKTAEFASKTDYKIERKADGGDFAVLA